MTPGSATHISRALRYLVRWMVRRDYSALSELNATASQEYLEDLARDLAEADETDPEIIPEATGSDDGASSGGKTVTSVVGRINIWRLLWRQSGALKDAGIDPLPNVPFAGRSPKSLARDLATKAMGWISPIPDEVALPIMAAAHRMLGVPAADVIRLHRLYLDARAAAAHCSVGRQALLAGKAIAGFAFSSIEGQNTPWRVPLYTTTSQRLHHGAWHTSHLDVHQALRALIEDVCAACIIVLQSEAGIRINEVCGLRAGISPDTRLPVCIEIRRSKTGLLELFFLKGTLAKTRLAPVEAEWLLGARPVGIKEIPAPVRAVQVLQELYAPLRSLPTNGTRCKDLIVQMTWPRGLPKNSRMIGKIPGVLARLPTPVHWDLCRPQRTARPQPAWRESSPIPDQPRRMPPIPFLAENFCALRVPHGLPDDSGDRSAVPPLVASHDRARLYRQRPDPVGGDGQRPHPPNCLVLL